MIAELSARVEEFNKFLKEYDGESEQEKATMLAYIDGLLEKSIEFINEAKDLSNIYNPEDSWADELISLNKFLTKAEKEYSSFDLSNQSQEQAKVVGIPQSQQPLPPEVNMTKPPAPPPRDDDANTSQVETIAEDNNTANTQKKRAKPALKRSEGMFFSRGKFDNNSSLEDLLIPKVKIAASSISNNSEQTNKNTNQNNQKFIDIIGGVNGWQVSEKNNTTIANNIKLYEVTPPGNKGVVTVKEIAGVDNNIDFSIEKSDNGSNIKALAECIKKSGRGFDLDVGDGDSIKELVKSLKNIEHDFTKQPITLSTQLKNTLNISIEQLINVEGPSNTSPRM